MQVVFLWKSNSEKTKHRQMLGRRVTAENAPTHNMNQSGTDLKREGERRHKEKLSPLPFELRLNAAQWEKRKHRAAFLRFTISACRFRTMARTGVLSSFVPPLPRWSTVRVDLIRVEDEKDYAVASSRIFFQARTRLAGFFWTSCGPPCWLLSNVSKNLLTLLNSSNSVENVADFPEFHIRGLQIFMELNYSTTFRKFRLTFSKNVPKGSKKVHQFVNFSKIWLWR